ncbi:MAG TPA: tetratricopeptide repeat protein [Chloroflexia bacterium]|nr:tetratricopeptide repeat protein [Chloroflexia bacterium]
MINPVEITDDEEYIPAEELPTNRLHSGALGAPERYGEQQPIDWLERLATRSISTQNLVDEPPKPQPEPSGMALHSAPTRMVPTAGARISTGLRRGVLMLILSVAAIGAIAGGVYVLASSTWLASLMTPTTSPASGSNDPQVQPPLAPQAQSPGQPAQDTQEAQSKGSAVELRDLGIEQYKAGKYAEAIISLESAVSLDGNDAVAYYRLGLAYMTVSEQEHSLADAELAFRTAVALQPEWASPHQGLAESLLRRQFYKEAITPALEATRLAPDLGEAWMTLGRAYQGAGQESEATQAFAQAARLAPPPPLP